jgi:hypothetical protein
MRNLQSLFFYALKNLSHMMSQGLLICLCIFFLHTDSHAQIAVPDSTRPGALRPEQTGKTTMPPAPPAEVLEKPGAVLEVPPVIDRPFEIDEGPKVAVSMFRMQEAVDLPDFGVSMVELQSLLQAEINAKPEGFTVGQLQEVADQVTLYYRTDPCTGGSPGPDRGEWYC